MRQERPRSCSCPTSGPSGAAPPTRRSGTPGGWVGEMRPKPCGTHPPTCRRTGSPQGWLGGLSATTAPTQSVARRGSETIHVSCGIKQILVTPWPWGRHAEGTLVSECLCPSSEEDR